MNIFKLILSNSLIRKSFFLFKIFSFDIYIKRYQNRRKFYLNTYRHKGYLFNRNKRDKFEIERFKEIIKKNDIVLDIGGHIGFLSQVFEELTGSNGKVIIVEPDQRNIRYLKKSILNKSVLMPIALSDKADIKNIYYDDAGGFTNSLLSDFDSNYDEYYEKIIKFNMKKKKSYIKTSTVDLICNQLSIKPDFIKIDVEGAELDVLKGSTKLLKSINNIMVEVSRNEEEVYKLLFKYNFLAKDNKNNIIKNEYRLGNIFFYKNLNK